MHEKSFSSPSTWDGVSLIDHQVRKVEGLDCINCHATGLSATFSIATTASFLASYSTACHYCWCLCSTQFNKTASLQSFYN